MVVILPYCIKAKRCEHNALGYWSGLALCLTKVRSSRACCPATALISQKSGNLKRQVYELCKILGTINGLGIFFMIGFYSTCN